ncbi:NeuD/PglB/VioB family sugar acetyltransferase [Roseomonas sp. CECT 9278]|uniref:NeuD/PglB/VioB family sugar acetyltransferase n=1 Tax=Roseomonas sp. CECT 9278 TaxID=2845823 RepID=UPI001E52523A|nr:NeuD/PglB/VioB family sugar acetyltransferase [Roseomonas sp. CECT 9278]CAH0232198.1 Putative acetyltransferase EpsM [Roseomonas sp. CECT 9278]
MLEARPAILVLGAGGHGKAVLDLLMAGGWPIAGVLDGAPRVAAVLGVPVLGDESRLPALLAAGVAAAHPAIGHNAQRAAAAARLLAAGFALPALVHPAATIGHGATLGEGAAVLARAVIGPEARIARLALVNTGAIVEHDCDIGEAAHVAPGAVLAGGVRIGAGALVGAGAVIRPGVRVGEGAIIGAGAAVLADVPPHETFAGVPAIRVPATRLPAQEHRPEPRP